MKTTLKIFLFLVVAFGFSATAMAQNNANASVTIMAPITITETAPLAFGNIIPHATTDGSVIITPAGGKSFTGGVTAPASATHAAATFTVQGQVNANISIVLPAANAVELTSGALTPLKIAAFSSTGAPTSLNASGSATINIGATLTVPAAASAGTYTGQYEFKVNYN